MLRSPVLAFCGISAKLVVLKDFPGQYFLRNRFPLAIVAGVALALAFPSFNFAGFAWIAPALMLAAAVGKTGGEAFRIGYVAGIAQYLASLYWLLFIPVTGYPILGWVALSAYCALYPATWVWLMTKVSGARSQVSGRADRWAGRTAWTLFGAAIWVALEMIIARLFSGFPWLILGNSQFRLLPLIQIASVTGVYGVSFLVVWFSLSLYSAAIVILRQPAARYAWLGEIIIPMTVLVGVFVFGLARLREASTDGPTLRVTCIQPSIPQKMIWASGEDSSWFSKVLDLTQSALTNKTDLMIWPEAAVPKMIRYDDEVREAITSIARSNRVWMIIGSDDAEARVNSRNPKEADYFNSSFLVNPEGELMARYTKRNLVIFGEYIPLVRWLPFVKWFTPVTGSFTAGDKVVPFELRDLRVKTATLICFEDVFPQLVPDYVNDDTDFLVNLTNDGWFGEGAEQWQHAAAGVFRSVENSVPLVRCCNNGLTCWIDSRGRIREVFRDQNSSEYGAGFATWQIPVLSAGEKRTQTFYNRHGDWFGWSCVVVASLTVIVRLRKR